MERRRRYASIAALIAAALVADRAAAAGIVALTDSSVAQYREALTAARDVDNRIEVVDAAGEDAAGALKRAAPGVVIAIGQKALDLAASTLPSTPVVFCMVLGATGDAARKITGIRMEVHPGKQLEYFLKINPAAKRLGIIYDPRSSQAYVDAALKSARSLGVTIVAEPVKDPKEIKATLTKIAPQIDALWLAPDPRLITAEMFSHLLVTTIEQRIALFGFLDAFARAGALAAVSPDLSTTGTAAAHMARDIAAGRDKGALPEPTFGPGTLSLNLKTARRLGLDVPDAVIQQARQVYK
jgi:putative tryptophan/tyrosine transport system substrate-binding protein